MVSNSGSASPAPVSIARNPSFEHGMYLYMYVCMHILYVYVCMYIRSWGKSCGPCGICAVWAGRFRRDRSLTPPAGHGNLPWIAYNTYIHTCTHSIHRYAGGDAEWAAAHVHRGAAGQRPHQHPALRLRRNTLIHTYTHTYIHTYIHNTCIHTYIHAVDSNFKRRQFHLDAWFYALFYINPLCNA